MVDVTEKDADEKCIEICEVYYDHVGKPMGYSTATMCGKDAGELRVYLTWAMDALNKPVLTFGDSDGNISQDN
jgi:hypothetical protein